MTMMMKEVYYNDIMIWETMLQDNGDERCVWKCNDDDMRSSKWKGVVEN